MTDVSHTATMQLLATQQLQELEHGQTADISSLDHVDTLDTSIPVATTNMPAVTLVEPCEPKGESDPPDLGSSSHVVTVVTADLDAESEMVTLQTQAGEGHVEGDTL